MKDLKLVPYADSGDCMGGNCEQVYVTEDHRFFVQGKVVSSDIKQRINVPEGEDLVEISSDLIRRLEKA